MKKKATETGTAMRRLAASRGRLPRAREGNVIVEYAAAAPILLVLMAILFDFGMAAYDSMSLKEAARASAQYAVKDSSDTDVLRQVAANASGLDPSNLTVTANKFCECADGTQPVCGSACPDLSTPRTYVAISVEEQYTTLLPYPSSLAPLTLRGDATLRIR